MGNDLEPILITGASGYLGNNVLLKLESRGLHCIPVSAQGSIGIQCELTDNKQVAHLLDKIKPRLIVHCAASVPKIFSAYEDNIASEENIKMVRNISENAQCRIVFISSMTVYDQTINFPADELESLSPLTSYAKGKWEAEQIILKRKFDGDVALRLPGLFGLPRRSGLIYNAIKSALSGSKFDLSPNPGIWAAMLVEDAADYVVRASMVPIKDDLKIINIGYEGEFSIDTAVAEIARYCNLNYLPPSIIRRPFSMKLDRMKNYYCKAQINFNQRLKEFIDVVREDLKLIGNQS
ncbi:NAD-dependent epimerase/dehydratase family protein [Leptospira noguchii]|uniref:dTDP-4-dehydrorhamnose reductase n=1 Tax=Leptospira noguchii serovar Autumnalis str. ZUN142 TaxID=1085540 RepID=M6UDK4_9LEPT|nr:NAD(P)-dependent oxidoreductase [Leptospira noguchii]EMO43152.1 NADH(P)-binding protein, PF13460 family [Leptospira noguchii serovar Autumnalis str. ZUN142]EMS88670.1 NADH(P)-binding protein, PF13460 family [Leptospira noguchii str. Hook]UOG47554.1 NAD(P)-dependent oxidoreductase [Leptospira noguchii]